MKETLWLRAAEPVDITHAATILRQGGTVAFPTETVYGLGANALDPAAVANIFAAKQRPAWDPLIVHIADRAQLAEITALSEDLGERVDALAVAFWPGPLTLLLPRSAMVPDAVTAGRALVGVRIPSHPVAQALLRGAEVPVAAPSANRFGHTSPTTAAHVLADLNGRIDAVLDGGATEVGVESTVLDPTQTPMVLYRPGAVTADAITRATGVAVDIYRSLERQEIEPEALPSPGVGIRHYAPRARVVLVEGNEAAIASVLDSAGLEERVGVLLPEGWSVDARAVAEPWGRWGDSHTMAARLFAGLRALDDRGATVIVCPVPESGGLNDAIRDRLGKAARTA
ncbi:MAG TPA: L-threonylcarbamoyladenylate synthase [Acidobacteriaceae bacterium]|jgi:L-threonylcarbamoyladenylate synthase